MVKLVRIAAALLVLAAQPASAAAGDRWAPHVAEASARFGIPADWIRKVIAEESGGRTTIQGHPTVSPAGAMGLMQLMPGTWAEMRSVLGLGGNPHDPRDNILAGTLYLRLLYDRFGYPGLFAAYNAGPARFSQFRKGTRQLPAETRAYVARVAFGSVPRGSVSLPPLVEHERSAQSAKPVVRSWGRAPLFVQLAFGGAP